MNPQNRRIVCATDFSANARGAADVAAAAALRMGATLVLVHVGDETHQYHEGTKLFRDHVLPVRRKLRDEGQRLRADTGAAVTEVLLYGQMADRAIGEFVEKHPPSLVVVSSVSKTTFDHWTIGSVSERVSQQSPVPTLVVRAPEPLLAWLRGERKLRVFVAVDFTASSDAALSWVSGLEKVADCAVTVAHVNWPPSEQRRLPRGKSLSMTRNSPVVQGRLLRDLRRKVGATLAHPTEMSVQPNWGRPDAALVDMASKAEADLVVVGTHQWHGLQRVGHASISRGVLRHAPMSVVCVPTSRAVAHGMTQRPQIQRVLVATDFSTTGDQAVPWAYATLAGGGTVKLVHVISPWQLPSPLISRYDGKRLTRGQHRRLINVARDKLAALVPIGTGSNRVATEVEVMVDRDPARAIGIAASLFGADVICLGSRGHSAVAETLLGSVARTVIAENLQPVLLVRPEPA
jgi:nucleotide-binding universal stress UspA family protein